MILFIHFEATRGADPYLTYLEAEAGPNGFHGLVRPPVSVQPPKGFTEQDLMRCGLPRNNFLTWLDWMCQTIRTVVVYDRDHFIRVMDAEVDRWNKSKKASAQKQAWYRPGIEIVDLADKATPLAKIEHGDGFRKPSFEEACLNILMENANGLESVKRLWEHKEIQQLCEAT